jgi:quercetin dioxygenase-like cupin family protein
MVLWPAPGLMLFLHGRSNPDRRLFEEWPPMLRSVPAAAVVLLAVLALPISAGAQQPAVSQSQDYPAVPLLSTSTTIIGEPIRYPASGQAHVTAAIVTVAPGGRTIVHKHGVPLFAYILEGELTVDYGPHGKRVYKRGEALMEAMDAAHFGANMGTKPVRLLAVYMGAAGAEDVIPER